MIQTGYLVAGGAAMAKEVLQTEDALALKETAEPGADVGYGKIWVSSADGLPYFKDDAGAICGLCGGGGGGAFPYPYFKEGSTRRFMWAHGIYNSMIAVGLALSTSGAKIPNNDDFTNWLQFTIYKNNYYTRSTGHNETRKAHNPTFAARFKTGPVWSGTAYVFLGVSEVLLNASYGDDPATGSTEYALLRMSNSSPNFYFITRDNAGNVESTDSGIPISVDTAYDFWIEMYEGGDVIFHLQEIFSSVYAEAIHDTYLPGDSTDLGMEWTSYNTVLTYEYFNMSFMSIECD